LREAKAGECKARGDAKAGGLCEPRNAAIASPWPHPPGRLFWAHRGVAVLAQGTTLSGAPRLALHPKTIGATLELTLKPL